MNITDAIKQVRTEYIESGRAPSYYQINNGQCDEFAEDVYSLVGDKEVNILSSWGLMCGLDGDPNYEERWNWDLLEKHWPVKLPKGLSKDEMNELHFGGHDFIEYKGKYYDAEKPEGVESFFDLPIFRRTIIVALRTKGIRTLGVATDDIVPPPPCPVPNPQPEYVSLGLSPK